MSKKKNQMKIGTHKHYVESKVLQHKSVLFGYHDMHFHENEIFSRLIFYFYIFCSLFLSETLGLFAAILKIHLFF